MDMGYQIETRLHNERRKREWTAKEDKNLLILREGGVPMDAICSVLDRGQRSVEIRLERLRQRGIDTHDAPKVTRRNPGNAGDTTVRDAIDGSRRLLKALLAYYERRAA